MQNSCRSRYGEQAKYFSCPLLSKTHIAVLLANLYDVQKYSFQKLRFSTRYFIIKALT